MAETLKPNGAESAEGTAAAGHNVANRTKIMSDALSETYKLDGQVQAALDKYVAPVREQKRDIKKRLNKELNITATVFNARYVAYKLEAQARAAEDEATLENLREFFEIAPVGHQMDFLGDDAAEGTSAPA